MAKALIREGESSEERRKHSPCARAARRKTLESAPPLRRKARCEHGKTGLRNAATDFDCCAMQMPLTVTKHLAQRTWKDFAKM